MSRATKLWSTVVVILLGPLAVAADKAATPAERPATPAPARVLDDKDLDAMWKDLARDDDDGVKLAYAHRAAMIRSATSSLPFLRRQLKAVAAPEPPRIAKWIGELDSGDFATRETAMRELGALGPLAAAPLKKKLEGPAPSLEARRRVERLLEKLETRAFSGDDLRQYRALDVLFGIGTPEARKVLEELSRGAAGAPLTEQAKICLAALTAANEVSPAKPGQ
jgi:hypothetical protein